MTQFTVDITDKGQLAGITAAKDAYNNSLTPATDEEGDPIAVEDRAGYIATDAAYFTARMLDVAASYSKHFEYDTETLMALKSQVAARTTKLEGAGVAVPDGP